LLLVETSAGYGRRILEGVGRYVREHGPWSLYFETGGLEDRLSPWITRWQGDGILARTTTPVMAEQLRKTGVPMIELLGDQPEQPAKVHGENASAGRMAAEHLLGCGLRSFGFFAYGDAWWSAAYRQGFEETIAMHRFACNTYRPPRANTRIWPKWRESMQPDIVAWLKSLPKPAGIFAPSIEYAGQVLGLCRNLNIAVPEEIAVLGAVDDPAICNLFTPPLSCVDLPAERIGYEAAAMLGRCMAGEKPPRRTMWIPATHVAERQSTDLVAIDDADVARAVRFIRENACHGIGVRQVVDHTGPSRRMLELKFQQHLGRTPKEEILKIKLDRAQLLLSQTEMSIEVIARKSGFPSFRHFASVFRRELGLTPRAFRRTNRVPHVEPKKGTPN
jgi:LacI family transcriptional regulator